MIKPARAGKRILQLSQLVDAAYARQSVIGRFAMRRLRHRQGWHKGGHKASGIPVVLL